MLKWWWPWHKSLTEYNEKTAQKWYLKYYTNNILKNLDSYTTYNELIKFGDGKPVILCCAGERAEYLFCHRHILGKWLEKNLPNIKVKEYPHPSQFLLLPQNCK